MRSKPARQNQDEEDDQNYAKNTDAPMTETVAITAESAAEATEQENDKQNDEYGSKRHGFFSIWSDLADPLLIPANCSNNIAGRTSDSGYARIKSLDTFYRNLVLTDTDADAGLPLTVELIAHDNDRGRADHKVKSVTIFRWTCSGPGPRSAT
jgi:hypothetical protein